MSLETVTIRPVYCLARTHMAGSALCTIGGWPISMIVVWMKLSAITSPRTPPMVMRSPTLNVFPRRMTMYPATDVTTFCSANAHPGRD